MTVASPIAAPRTKPRLRVPFWDNARFATIVLVVIGHAIQRLTSDSDTALTLYLFIYAFHIPAFAMISGYFSKASPPRTRNLMKVVSDLLVPYVIFQGIWSLVQFLVEGNSSVDFAQPHWTLWFLLALAGFRVALPYLVLLRWPLLWAVLLSIAVGYSPGVDSTFSLARGIGILPFFVLGWQLRQWKVADRWMSLRWQVWPVRAAALLVFAGWVTTIILLIKPFRELSVHWFFYDDSYSGLDAQQWWAGFVRLGLIVLAVILCFAFFALIPRRHTVVTAFGGATLYVYLLHSFLLYPIRQSGLLAGSNVASVLLLVMVATAILIAVALSTPIVRRVFRPLIEPSPRWLFTPDAMRASTKGRAAQRRHHTDPTGSRSERERPTPPRLTPR